MASSTGAPQTKQSKKATATTTKAVAEHHSTDFWVPFCYQGNKAAANGFSQLNSMCK